MQDIQDCRPIYGVFCFRFYLLFVSALWFYGVGLGPDLFVYFFAEKAWMGSLGKLFASMFFDSI